MSDYTRVRFVLWVWHFKKIFDVSFWQFVYTYYLVLLSVFFVYLRMRTNSNLAFLSALWVSFIVRLNLFSSRCQSFVSSLPFFEKNFLRQARRKIQWEQVQVCLMAEKSQWKCEEVLKNFWNWRVYNLEERKQIFECSFLWETLFWEGGWLNWIFVFKFFI